MDGLKDTEELSYDEIDQTDTEKLSLLYDEAHRKVDGQLKVNSRIEDHSRQRLRTIFLIFGSFLTILSFSIPLIASGEVRPIVLSIEHLNTIFLILQNSAYLGGNSSYIIVWSLAISSIGYFSITIGYLLTSFYYNMSVSRTSLMKLGVASGRLQKLIHDTSKMNAPRKCILYEYSDTIALNKSVLQEKWVDKELADDAFIRAFWNLLWFFLIVYLAFLTMTPSVVILTFLLSTANVGYGIAKLLGYVDEDAFFGFIRSGLSSRL